jgi:hypothetical protein
LKKVYLVGLILTLWFSVFSQNDSISLSGKYYETSLYIFNPSIAEKFSIFMVVVNGDSIIEDLNSNAIEVDFQLLGVEAEADINLIIYFDSLFPPVIINPEVLFSPTKFKFSKPRIRKDELSWRTYGDMSEYPIEVYQFRWNSWRLISEVDPLDTIENSTYSIEIKQHSGENLFRLKTTNLQEEVVYSKELSSRPPNVSEVFIKEYKVVNEIEFTSESDYEIFDLNGEKMLTGRDRYIDVTSLPSGEYWINYDNKTEKVKKK